MKKNKDVNNNIMQIRLIEICHNVLNYDYTYCNATFVHINTNPPEYRHNTMKYKHKFKQNRIRANILDSAIWKYKVE